jgi:XTP/dITP diphosphohydrolase
MLLEKLEDKDDRTCHYTTVIALKDANEERVFEYTLDGKIADNCRGDNGFGFDEIFEIENGKTLAEISTEEKISISPRTKALEKIEQYLIEKE